MSCRLTSREFCLDQVDKLTLQCQWSTFGPAKIDKGTYKTMLGARQLVRGGAQVLRSFKPRIQAKKPQDIHTLIGDTAVVSFLLHSLMPMLSALRRNPGALHSMLLPRARVHTIPWILSWHDPPCVGAGAGAVLSAVRACADRCCRWRHRRDRADGQTPSGSPFSPHHPHRSAHPAPIFPSLLFLS